MGSDISDNKKRLLEALEKTLGNVSEGCRQANVSRDTHYRWLKEDEVYKLNVEELTNVAIDFVEGKLFEKINGISMANSSKDGEVVYKLAPSDTAIIFFLKTKAKKRGYVERSEITGADGKDLSIPIVQWVTADENKAE